MNTHALVALTTDGRRLEIGRVVSLEKAVRLGRILYDELGDEYTRLELIELDPETEFYEWFGSVGGIHITRLKRLG